MPRTIRALLFDATGTLFEASETIGETYHRFAAEYGAEISAWRLDDAFRRVLSNAPPLCFRDHSPEEVPEMERDWWRNVVRQTLLAADSAIRVDDFEACFEALFSYYATGRAWRLRAGARSCLEALAAEGLALGVLSNFDGRLHNILEEMDIAHFFSSISTPSSSGHRKPEEAAFRHALAGVGASSADTVFVGDDPLLDLAAARALGFSTFDASASDALCELPARISRSDSSLHFSDSPPATLAGLEPLEDPE